MHPRAGAGGSPSRRPSECRAPSWPARSRRCRTSPGTRYLRAGLRIEQGELAHRAGVGRQWIIAFEQGKPTLDVAKVFRTLEALGFELVVTPTTRPRPGCCAPPPPPPPRRGSQWKGYWQRSAPG